MTDPFDRPPDAEWIGRGRGIGPSLKWSFGTEGPLTGLALAREAGVVLAGDETGGLYLLDRQGQYSAVTRTREPVRDIALSDDAQSCVALIGDAAVHRFDQELKTQWQLELPAECLAVATDAFGQYVAVSLVQGTNVIYDANKRRVAQFDSIRPLSFLNFVVSEAVLIGAADHGLVCCMSLSGERLWEEKNWSNVGCLAITGDGELIYVAAFAHGVQVYDGDGDSVGSYVVEGTVKKLASSYEPHRIVASTLERHLYVLDPDGELIWATKTPGDIVRLASDAFGEFVVCGFADGHVVGLDWSRG